MLTPASRANYMPLPVETPASSDSEGEMEQGFDWNAARTPGMASLADAFADDDDDIELVTEDPVIVMDYDDSPAAKRGRTQ